MAVVVVISGSVASGKTTLASALVGRWGGALLSTREVLAVLAAERGVELRSRQDYQNFGDRLDADYGGDWVADAAERLADIEGRLLVIDAVRTAEQIMALRAAYGRALVHVHLAATDRDELARRYRSRTSAASPLAEFETYDEVSKNLTEAHIETLAHVADVVLDTVRSTKPDLVVRCEARLGLLPALTQPLVDVVVGGQYGSEGKGNIAYYLAPEYDVLVRVGGPNAGHKVRHNGEVLTHRSIPSGALANPSASLVIGPGAVVNHATLMQELKSTRVDTSRLKIDPQAMVISPEDVDAERALRVAIQSTAQGAGAAAARRILGRADAELRLVRDSPEFAPFVSPTAELLESAFAQDKRVLVEGTQGTGLSLYHGHYPYVTSRDTTVAGTLAEAGIGPRRVRRTIMVVRSYPIRVNGASGPIGGGRELKWEEIEARSGADNVGATELSSVTQQLRRVAEFDWSLLRRSAELNSATDIALTFADYISVHNRRAYRYDQLKPGTLQFVEELESVSGASASLIATDFSERAIIDRRTWREPRT